MKEKIWIEKLIRYLLESKWEEYKEEYYEWYRDVELEQNIDSLSDLKPFIKWLVENDKIDREKMWRFKAERKNTQIISIANKSDFYLSLLMLLSISDTPIEDLLLYLK